jgi:hypothetical protein
MSTKGTTSKQLQGIDLNMYFRWLRKNLFPKTRKLISVCIQIIQLLVHFRMIKSSRYCIKVEAQKQNYRLSSVASVNKLTPASVVAVAIKHFVGVPIVGRLVLNAIICLEHLFSAMPAFLFVGNVGFGIVVRVSADVKS